MIDLGYKLTMADPDVWLKPAHNKNNIPCYNYVLVYVDDIIVISTNPTKFIDRLRKIPYPLKRDDGPPMLYLGALIGQYNEREYSCWTMSAEKYLDGAIAIVEECICDTLTIADTPMRDNYKPELDCTQEVNDLTYTYYLNFIGILQWTMELGCIDIAYATSTLSQYSANPQEGHIQAVLRVFGYLKKHQTLNIVFDAQPQNWSGVNWKEHECNDYYPGAIKAIPPNPHQVGECPFN